MTQTQRPPVQSIATRDVEQLSTSLAALSTIVRELKEVIVGRPDLDRQWPISSSFQYILDYRERFFVFLFSPVALSLSAEDYGTIGVPPNTWVQLPFPQSTRIFAVGQVAQVVIQVRCTDRLIPTAYSGGATISSLHNTDNQTIPTGPALLVDNISNLVSPIGTSDRQLEVGADAQPSHGIVSGGTNLKQTQSSNATGTITAGQTGIAVITPTTMTSGMVAFNEIDVDFGTANQETGFIVSATATTVTVQPINGSPGAPLWKFSHSGTYKIQVAVYNVERDIMGEGSGFLGTGMPPAVEVEWNSGGPLLSTGLPSLDQYDRETLILGQGTDSQAITASVAGNTTIVLTSAKATLTPLQPIRLTGGAISETVYVDQSYVVGSNTVIPLKHPVVNAGQTLATWQKYASDGPLANLVPLYGEGMEGVLLGDSANPGFGRFWQGSITGYANIANPSGVPTSVTPANANGTATAGTATATLTGAAAKFTYLTAIIITIIGTATAGSAELSLTGAAGGTLLFEIDAPGTVGLGPPIIIPFPYPLQSSAVNTNIVATLPTLGAGTGKVSVVLIGYLL